MITRTTRNGIILLSALTVLSFWATREQDSEEGQARMKIDARLDYALKNFELLFFDRLGQPSLKMRSPSFESDAASGNGLAIKPVLEVRHEGFLWNIIADSAIVTDAQDFIYLNDNVQMQRNGESPADWLQIDGQEVTLEIAPRIVSSDLPVEVQDPAGRMTATGFSVNMSDNSFNLVKDVKGVYVLP
jgi:LPS export ABC transporter protein LptC